MNSDKIKLKSVVKAKLGITNLDNLTIGRGLFTKHGLYGDEELQKFGDKFKAQRILGIGQFGVVILVTSLSDGS
jgi:hypothetical protein